MYWSKLNILKSNKLLYLLIAILLLRLNLAGIYNYIHPAFVEMYEKELNRPLPPQTNDDVKDQVPKDIISEVNKFLKVIITRPYITYKSKNLSYARVMNEKVVDMLYRLLLKKCKFVL